VTIKTATSLDGRIATRTGESRWITGEVARRHGHLLRASYDAIIVGSGTVLADNPELTCRLPGLGDRSPIRIVIDGRLRLPLDSALVSGARMAPTWLVTLRGGHSDRLKTYRACGVEILEVNAAEGGVPDLAEALRAIGARGITRLLAEGGAVLATALLRANLVDRLVWFRAPQMIGGDGLAAVQTLGVETLGQACRFVRRSTSEIESDLVETYDRAS